MSRKVEVFHAGDTGFVHVANVTVPNDVSDSVALEYAWRWTNNVEGSWSIKEKFFTGPGFGHGEKNGDFNENVEVLVPLHQYNGKTFGLRSSMVGDRFVLDGVAHRVASFGFGKE